MINSPELSPGDVQPSRAFVQPHIVNGGVASYIVRDAAGTRVANYSACSMGLALAEAHARDINHPAVSSHAA